MKKISKSIFASAFFALVLSFVFAFFPIPAGAQNSKCMTSEECTSYIQQNVDAKLTGRIIKADGCSYPSTGACVLDNLGIKLNVPFSDSITTVKNYDDYLNRLFQFLLGGAGVVAVVMLVLGGYTYITAAGNQSRVSKAKEFIVDAIVGLFLVFGSVIFLGQINESLVSKSLNVGVVAPVQIDQLQNCTDPADLNDKPALCGAITTNKNDDIPCISMKCASDNNVCLPYDIGQISGTGLSNQATAYKCYLNNTQFLKTACEEAPLSQCDKINKTSVGTTNYGLDYLDDKKEDACVKGSQSCIYGEKKLTCPSGGKVDCAICRYITNGNNPIKAVGSFLTDDTYLYCDNNQVAYWEDDGVFIGRDEMGVICCENKDWTRRYYLYGYWGGIETTDDIMCVRNANTPQDACDYQRYVY